MGGTQPSQCFLIQRISWTAFGSTYRILQSCAICWKENQHVEAAFSEVGASSAGLQRACTAEYLLYRQVCDVIQEPPCKGTYSCTKVCVSYSQSAFCSTGQEREKRSPRTRYKERTQDVRKLLVSCCTLVLVSYVLQSDPHSTMPDNRSFGSSRVCCLCKLISWDGAAHPSK